GGVDDAHEQRAIEPNRAATDAPETGHVTEATDASAADVDGVVVGLVGGHVCLPADMGGGMPVVRWLRWLDSERPAGGVLPLGDVAEDLSHLLPIHRLLLEQTFDHPLHGVLVGVEDLTRLLMGSADE